MLLEEHGQPGWETWWFVWRRDDYLPERSFFLFKKMCVCFFPKVKSLLQNKLGFMVKSGLMFWSLVGWKETSISNARYFQSTDFIRHWQPFAPMHSTRQTDEFAAENVAPELTNWHTNKECKQWFSPLLLDKGWRIKQRRVAQTLPSWRQLWKWCEKLLHELQTNLQKHKQVVPM